MCSPEFSIPTDLCKKIQTVKEQKRNVSGKIASLSFNRGVGSEHVSARSIKSRRLPASRFEDCFGVKPSDWPASSRWLVYIVRQFFTYWEFPYTTIKQFYWLVSINLNGNIAFPELVLTSFWRIVWRISLDFCFCFFLVQRFQFKYISFLIDTYQTLKNLLRYIYSIFLSAVWLIELDRFTVFSKLDNS